MRDEKQIDRRALLKGIGASTVALAQIGSGGVLAWAHHPLVPQTGNGPWTPRFLTEAETVTVTQLSERIVPATETPGAAAAKVFQYIDYVLSEAPTEEQMAFRKGLAWLEATSRERHQKAFGDLETPQQDALLAALAVPDSSEAEEGILFFGDIKQRTIEGYYRSEVGMMEELGFDGNTILGSFQGCTHPEHLSWTPPSDDQGGAR